MWGLAASCRQEKDGRRWTVGCSGRGEIWLQPALNCQTLAHRISFINIRRTIWRETQARQDIYRIKLWDLGWVILLQEKFGNSQLGFLDLHTMGAYFSPVCWSIWETLGAIEVKVSSNTHLLFGFFALESRNRFCWLPVTFSSYVFSLIFWYIDFFPPMTRCEWTSLIMVIQI